MKETKDIYWASSKEIEGYYKSKSKKIIKVDSQDYLVFPIDDNPGLGVAWPTTDGKLTSLPTTDIQFDSNDGLQYQINTYLENPYKLILFPRWFLIPMDK